MNQQLNVALVGLGFGGSFVPIYRDHPLVGQIGVFDPDNRKMELFTRALGNSRAYRSFEEILEDETVDAVHLVSPIPEHEEQTLQVLRAGKHCACTVPMATSLEGIKRIVDAVRASGKKYMMMETTVYTHPFFEAKDLWQSGELGRIQFLRGCHYQDMRGWPDYWQGLPPMYYGTHALSPLRVLADSPVTAVCCVGSGTMDEALRARYQNPYPVESALLFFENGLKAEVTRSLFETARPYLEGFYVYGSEASFEWGFEDASPPTLSRIRPRENGLRGCDFSTVTLSPSNRQDLLPESIRRYTIGGGFDPTNPHLSFKEGARGGHHGSHPHMVHEFLTAIAEDRKPWFNETLAANISAACVCAHTSAMREGEKVYLPVF